MRGLAACVDRPCGAGVGTALVLTLLVASPARSATIVVDARCDLADAITAANTDAPVGSCLSGSPGEDTIEQTVDVTLTVIDNSTPEGDNGLPVISSPITLRGNGFEILRESGSPRFRIFQLVAGGELTVVDSIVRNGRLTIAPTGGNGGAFHVGSGATLTLLGTTVFGSEAYEGGAIYLNGGDRDPGGE